MQGFYIFDQSMDLIFKKMNNEIVKKIKELAIAQNLMLNEDEELDDNIIMQIFSPIINSQKIMFCQFDNTYTSLQCEGNMNFVFSEFLGYIFVRIGIEKVENLRRNIGVCISFAKHICGPNIYELKNREDKSNLYTDIINTWENLQATEQCILLEGIDQLIVNADIKNAIKNTLKSATEILQHDSQSQRCHTIIFVSLKFAGIFSSRHAQKLSPCDLLFLCILTETFQSKVCPKAISIQSNLIFFEGQTFSGRSGCIPYIVHTSLLDKGFALTLLIESSNLTVFSSGYDSFFALQKLRNIQVQGDFDNFRSSYDSLDVCIRQLGEAFKKAKFDSCEIQNAFKKLSTRWENLKKKYLEYFKNNEKELIVQIESNIPVLLEELQEFFKVTCLEYGILENGFARISEISTLVEETLLEFSEFLSVKAQRNLSIESYLEEFPGLVHFIFLNRTIGTIAAPDLVPDKFLIPKEKIWNMVEITRTYLSKGYNSLMWKDSAFNYTYFLWFEDQNGIAMKPKEVENFFTGANVMKPEYEPGVLTGNYYQRLCEIFFPKIPLNKIKCCELYCIHLGLVTATCALEHARRLVATIADVTGTPSFDVL